MGYESIAHEAEQSGIVSKCRKIKSRGKLMLKASHWSRYVEGTLVNMKNVVGNFVTHTGTIHGGLKYVSYNISMETRLYLKSISSF